MTKDKVLNILKNTNYYVSGQSIAQNLQISRTAVWKAIKSLQSDGYNITSHSYLGYRLIETTKNLTAQEIKYFLNNHSWSDNIIVLDSIDSTNNYAKKLAAAGAPEGTAVIAENQTKGRGRLGRSFISFNGKGIYLSIILRPKVQPTSVFHLTASVAEAVAEAIEKQTGLECGIKWVNDLVVGKRKLAGILTELSVEAESGMINYIVIGIGINCLQNRDDFPCEIANFATSISSETGNYLDRNELVASILMNISDMSKSFITKRSEWMNRYKSRCITIGQHVKVLKNNGSRDAIALGIDDNAALEVEYPDGSRECIATGEVSVRGLYGYI